MKTVDVVQALVQDAVSNLGYELIDVEFQKEQTDWVLTLYIDKPDGVTVDDCERVSRAVEPLLDEADPISQSYFLSVSSPGLDRPLKKERDFERSLNKDIVVKLYAPQDKKKEFTGTLLRFDAESLTIAENGRERTILRKDAANIRPHIVF
ncbi:MAG TPA: ribosome maturation factor RimP [Feifaniaceae bacterium]|nr:ribosome maturation factor RimP [Feifaniaceae bacterium]